jgi:hypothetical protein
MARARNRISFEPLESRLLLNGQTLTGLGQTAGGWSDPSNWSGGASGAYPGSDNQADTLVFSAANYSGFYNTANNNLSNLSLAGSAGSQGLAGSTTLLADTGSTISDAPIAYSRIAGKRPDRQPRWPDCQVRCG